MPRVYPPDVEIEQIQVAGQTYQVQDLLDQAHRGYQRRQQFNVIRGRSVRRTATHYGLSDRINMANQDVDTIQQNYQVDSDHAEQLKKDCQALLRRHGHAHLIDPE